MRKSAVAVRGLWIFFFCATCRVFAQETPFDAVWGIFNTPAGPDSYGCNGCHIGPDETSGVPYWGEGQDQVLASIEAAGLVVGGRQSYLASRLRNGEMPRSGLPWTDEQLQILDNWLITYEDPFDAVFELFNQPAGPDSFGCNGCHVGPDENPPAPYWGELKQDVLASIEAAGLVVGGRQSYLADRIRSGSMPRGGMLWTDQELAILDAWLIRYEQTGGEEIGPARR